MSFLKSYSSASSEDNLSHLSVEEIKTADVEKFLTAVYAQQLKEKHTKIGETQAVIEPLHLFILLQSSHALEWCGGAGWWQRWCPSSAPPSTSGTTTSGSSGTWTEAGHTSRQLNYRVFIKQVNLRFFRFNRKIIFNFVYFALLWSYCWGLGLFII